MTVPPISLVLATRARDYVSGLTGYRYVGESGSPRAQGGIARWVGIFAAAAARAAADAESFRNQLDALVLTWREQAAPIRANSTADLLLGVLPAAPVVTVALAAKLVGRSVQATNQAFEHLVRAGGLVPTRPVRWNRAFEAVGLLDALTRFERGLASQTGDTRQSPPARPVPYRPR